MEFIIEFTVTTPYALTVEADSFEEALEQIENESSFDELDSTYSEGYIHCDESGDECYIDYSTDNFDDLISKLKASSKEDDEEFDEE